MIATIGLVGNPNSGKTTVFNALTGSKQTIGNWPGVTVERKSGYLSLRGAEATKQSLGDCFDREKHGLAMTGGSIEVVDLPGTYSLINASETSSLDERIACEFIRDRKASVIVNIIDANNLERNLYLTTQLIEMQVPIIVAVNMMDVAKRHGLQIDLPLLEKKLGCPVVALEANRGKGMQELKQKIFEIVKNPIIPINTITYPEQIQKAIQELKCESWIAIRLLEDDVYARSLVSADIISHAELFQKQIQLALQEDADILLADARYRFIHELVKQVITHTQNVHRTWTSLLDKVVLNRVLGIPIFLAVMYGMFLFAINIGGAFQDFFDIGSDTIFVDGLSHLLEQLHSPTWLTALLANGVGKGINTTITFIPVIGAMFLALAFLEDSGYMARAAFVIDRLMRALGLPGKSFVPMIVGFGCNVPAVMAARTLDNQRDRILTVMMSPFMSCGARLAIYAVFTAAFFPHGGQNVVFALYFIGIATAMLTGLLLRKTLLKGDPAPLILELPPYHVPRVKTLCLLAWQRLKSFVFRAGKLIVPICVLIGALNALNIDGTMNSGDGSTQSLLSAMGQWLTPIFAPMGIHQNNWPATVGLVTGVLAKEVVVGTLNTLYTELGHFAAAPDAAFHFWAGLQNAIASIPANFSQFGSSLANPVLAKAPVHTVTEGVYGLMAERFDGRAGAMAYLLFVLLYFPCISTTAAMLRELNRSWTGFSVVWTTVVAYGAAVIFYQFATFFAHPVSSLAWILGIVSVFFSIVILMRFMSSEKGGRYEFARN